MFLTLAVRHERAASTQLSMVFKDTQQVQGICSLTKSACQQNLSTCSVRPKVGRRKAYEVS